MKERPILFSAPMVQAILAGNKTQTRRVVKIPDNGFHNYEFSHMYLHNAAFVSRIEGVTRAEHIPCPYGQIGDQLWVRETFCPIFPQDKNYNNGKPIEYDYKASYNHGDRLGDLIGIRKKWTPSIHMPRRASRIQLEIIAIRVERLNSITVGDPINEGVESLRNEGEFWRDYSNPDGKGIVSLTCNSAYESFMTLWESINGDESWTENPWVWVIEFKRVEGAA